MFGLASLDSRREKERNDLVMSMKIIIGRKKINSPASLNCCIDVL